MTFFLVFSYRIWVLRSNSSAKLVLGAVLGLNRNPSLWSKILCGTLPWNARLGSQSNTGIVCRVVIQDCNG